MSGYTITARGLAKTYHPTREQTITALADVSFDVAAGSAVALMGPSGSGKSTLLHVLGAMDTLDSGQLSVGEHELMGMSGARQVAYRRTIGFVFQRFHLLPALTVEDNIRAPVLPYPTSFDKRDRARRLAAEVGLSGRAHALPSQLSGGQQQRVAIARALINQPGLILADEPTGNLDTTTGQEILGLLHGIRRTHRTTIVVATHDAAVARTCDQTISLRDGRIVEAVPS